MPPYDNYEREVLSNGRPRFGHGDEVKEVRPWHESLIDMMIQHPHLTQRELAGFFGVTEGWLSTVKRSDAFQELYAQRREAHFSRVSETVVDRVETMAEMTLDRINERVEQEGDDMSLDSLVTISKLALNSLGFGGRGGSVNGNIVNNTQNVMVVAADKEALRKAQETLSAIRQKVLDPKVINAEEESHHAPALPPAA